MTIYEKHEERVAELKKKHRAELDELEGLLRTEQKSCEHQWKRYEDLFYALGETYPGERCDMCGAQRKV